MATAAAKIAPSSPHQKRPSRTLPELSPFHNTVLQMKLAYLPRSPAKRAVVVSKNFLPSHRPPRHACGFLAAAQASASVPRAGSLATTASRTGFSASLASTLHSLSPSPAPKKSLIPKAAPPSLKDKKRLRPLAHELPSLRDSPRSRSSEKGCNGESSCVVGEKVARGSPPVARKTCTGFRTSEDQFLMRLYYNINQDYIDRMDGRMKMLMTPTSRRMTSKNISAAKFSVNRADVAAAHKPS